MDAAYGGISTTTNCPYSKTLILAAALDSLYTSGHCETRLQGAGSCASAATNNPFEMNVYPGAEHGFDQVTRK